MILRKKKLEEEKKKGGGGGGGSKAKISWPENRNVQIIPSAGFSTAALSIILLLKYFTALD